MKRKRLNLIQKSLRLTIEQWRKLDDLAFEEGVEPMVLARNLLADALNVPRGTFSENLRDSIRD